MCCSSRRLMLDCRSCKILKTNIMEKEENEKRERKKEEFKLAEQMKEAFCDISGKETNPTEAAVIMHKIGVIYRDKSPDKISLIKSAGLYNAAIVRNPSNASQIKSDLYELCQHILQQANAANQNANLIDKAKQIKTVVSELRSEVEMFLTNSVTTIPANAVKTTVKELNVKKISEIQKLNKMIAKKYKNIMADLSQFCEDAIGKPPCEYAVIGMGSLAREEITPYSDFEHIILLNDDKNYKSYLEYFRWYSVIFHIVVLNLQETIVPSLNIRSLNNKNFSLGDWYYDAYTPRGISFDGMMPHACKFPLGRRQLTEKRKPPIELIKPVSEMLEYLTSEADLKNGYHLADILTKTCFVYGNESIFKQFKDGAETYRNKKLQTDILNNVQQQVKDDFDRFATRFRLTSLKSQDSINIKQLVYRSSTLFVAALAGLYRVSANTSFDMVDEMANKNKITQYTTHKLQCAIAIACEMRLRVYTKNKSQNDNAIDLKQDGIEKFLDIVGLTSTINYFQIAYCLQCEVAKQLNFPKLYFYSDPQLVNITIGLAFGIQDLARFSSNVQKRFWDSKKFDFETCIKQLESHFKLGSRMSENPSNSLSITVEQIKSIANYLYSTNVYDEALDFYKQMLEIYRSQSINKECDYDIAWANQKIGDSLLKLFLSADALNYYKRALDIYQNTSVKVDKKRDIYETLKNIAGCYTYLHNYDLALSYVNQSLDIEQDFMIDAGKNERVAVMHMNIGYVRVSLEQYDVALIYLNRAIEFRYSVTLDSENDSLLAIAHCNIGLALNGLRQYDDAWNSFKQALNIFQNLTPDERIDRQIADIYNYLGENLIEKNQYSEAFTYIDRAIKIYEASSTKEKKDSRHARVLYNNGVCLMGLQSYETALNYLNQSLAIFEEYTKNKYIRRKIAKICRKIKQCKEYLG